MFSETNPPSVQQSCLIVTKIPKSEFHVLKSKLFEEYIKECDKLGYTKTNRYNKPLHLYSFYVYLAYNHAWKFINREKLDKKQIDIMKKLDCYKLSRTDFGERRFPPMYFAELPLVF
jgi:hypothetical protein